MERLFSVACQLLMSLPERFSLTTRLLSDGVLRGQLERDFGGPGALQGFSLCACGRSLKSVCCKSVR